MGKLWVVFGAMIIGSGYTTEPLPQFLFVTSPLGYPDAVVEQVVARGIGRQLEFLLYEVNPGHPTTPVVVTLPLIVVAMLAVFVSAG